jgi:ankyrin repeat protein
LLRENPGIIESMTAADHRAITNAAWNGDARAVALMSDLGFDPRTQGHDGGTALHCAAWQGSTETVAVLLRRRDARDLLPIKDSHYGATPLGWCFHGSRFGNTSHDHAGVARLLLDAGARPGPGPVEASPAVEAVLTSWRRRP